MKKYLFVHLLTGLTFWVNAQDAGTLFSHLGALQGTWSMQTRRGVINESWEKTNDSVYSGKSYRVVNTDTMLLETVQLVKKGNDIFYIPVVTGQNQGQAVSFRLITADRNTFTFDNPEHDFPQRVIYQLTGNNTLQARIEGMDKGSYRKSDFNYTRVE